MPKLWNATIAAHREQVRDAIMRTTAELAATHGLRALTMSRVAATTGIGRATLYKYFPSVEAILLAWHERQIADHLDRLADARDRAESPVERLEAVLRAYALMLHDTQGRHDAELHALVHRDEQMAAGRERLRSLVLELVDAGVRQKSVREDVPPDELATYCLEAVSAARRARSTAAVERLVAVTLSGLRSA